MDTNGNLISMTSEITRRAIAHQQIFTGFVVYTFTECGFKEMLQVRLHQGREN
jgi:hypothetical protein